MFSHKYRLVGLTILILLAVNSAHAAPVSYNIAWTGEGNYSMTGMFRIDDSLLGTGAIDESSVDYLTIEGFLNGVSLGSNVIDPENFNFDTNSETFIVGDLSLGPQGQLWNSDGPGVGFGSGRRAQGLYLEGAWVADSRLEIEFNSLTATRVVPIPGAVWLFGSALMLLGWLKRPR